MVWLGCVLLRCHTRVFVELFSFCSTLNIFSLEGVSLKKAITKFNGQESERDWGINVYQSTRGRCPIPLYSQCLSQPARRAVNAAGHNTVGRSALSF